jgi:hypothetical protein
MPKTAVGLFDKPAVVDDVVREIEALGFPRQEVRKVEEPATFEITGVMSFPRLDFEVDLKRELTRIGARGLRRRIAARRSPGSRDRRGRERGCRRGRYEPARRRGDRRDQWSGAGVAARGSREHASDAGQSGHGWTSPPAGRRRLPFRVVAGAGLILYFLFVAGDGAMS